MKLRTSILPAFFMEPVKNYFKFKRLHLNLITNALFYNLLKFFLFYFILKLSNSVSVLNYETERFPIL